MSSISIYRLIAAVMLAGMGVHRLATLRTHHGSEQYQARVREAAAAVPRQIGGWVGQDMPVGERSQNLLKPNVILSRNYLNVENGASAGLLLVHCSDSHHMAGHWPMRCYPAQGWKLTSDRPRDWTVGRLTLTGTEYQFAMDVPGRTRSISVINCLLLPGGRIVRDMQGMARAIAGGGGQATPAGQIQIFFEGDVPREKRDEAARTLIEGYMGVIEAILAPAEK